jgi:DNA-binding MarR family transcriptional regulator
MSKRSSLDYLTTVAEMIENSTDLMWRGLLSGRKDLNPGAALVLNRLDREGPMRLTALAAAEDTRQPAMTQLVQRMEIQGLVERQSDPADGRVALVAISAGGRELWDRRTDTHRSRLAGLLAELPADDARALWLAAQVAAPILSRLADIGVAQAKTCDAPTG